MKSWTGPICSSNNSFCIVLNFLFSIFESNLLRRNFRSKPVAPIALRETNRLAVLELTQEFADFVDDFGQILKTFPSVSKAAKDANVDPHTLRDRINEKYKYVGKAKYRYLSFEECAYFTTKKFNWTTHMNVNGYDPADSSYCLKTGGNIISFFAE